MKKQKKVWIIIGIILLVALMAIAVFLSFRFDFWGRKSEGPYDISISTQAGFTADKIEEIRALDGVDSLVGVCEQITDSSVIQSFPETVITPTLTEGRRPQAVNEVVIDSRYAAQKNMYLGQKISLTIGKTTTLYTVVGIAAPCFDMQSPAKPFFFVDLSAFHTDGYNRLYLCVSRSASVSSVEKEISALGYVGQKHRYELLRKGVQSKIDETEKLMETVLEPIKKELDQAKEQLDAAEEKLDLSGNTAKLAAAEKKLQDAKTELDSGREELDRIKGTLEATPKELLKWKSQLQNSREEFETLLAEAGVAETELADGVAQLGEALAATPEDGSIRQRLEQLKALQTMQENLKSEQEEYNTANTQYLRDLQTYQFGEYGYEALAEEYKAGLAEYEEQKAAFEAGKTDFYAKKAEYRQAEQEYLSKKQEYEQQMETYQQELDAIQLTDWTISRFGQDGTLLWLEDAEFESR